MVNKVFIAEYRGFEIFFDANKETFSYNSDSWDAEKHGKKSFAVVKKEIDEFIKNNSGFQPFLVQCIKWADQKPLSSSEGLALVKGVRKDGVFVLEDGSLVGKYDEKFTYLVDESNESVFEELKVLVEEKNRLKKELGEVERVIRSCQDKLKLIRLEDYRETLCKLGQIPY